VLLKVGVIPAGPGRAGLEFVAERLVRRHRLLGDPGDPIHRVRNVDAVPVHRRRFGEAVLQHDPDALAFLEANLGPRNLAVVGHGLDDLAGSQLPGELSRLQTNLSERRRPGTFSGAGVPGYQAASDRGRQYPSSRRAGHHQKLPPRSQLVCRS
jgi:hypothetical protein